MRWSFGPVLLVSLLVGDAALAQGPAMPDPRQMSGIPRVDPQTEPGTIVARVLRGSFQDPGVGLTVTLEISGADGKAETRTAVSDAQGRATFDVNGLAGTTAIASVDFEGERVKSQLLNVDPNVGVRVLLVQGAAAAAAAGPAGPARPSAEGGPRPGAPFPNEGQTKGTIMVGALDLAANRPFAGIEVRLEVTPPGEPVEVRRVITDGRGAASFAGLSELPAGTTFTAETELNGEPRRSETFTLDGQEHGVAVVLTARGGESASAPARVQRRPLQPPKAVATVPPGMVKATVIGPDDRPMPALSVKVVRLDISGTSEDYVGESDKEGVARVGDIRVAEDSLYRVDVTYKGAPFRSRLFQMTDRMGVIVEVRVFPTTSDASRVRSGVQFGIEAVENDLARVVQIHQLVVEGDQAFWPATPLKVKGPDEATGMVLLEDRVNVDLEHKEGAPFATLREPLPPGEVTDMSIAYLMPHRGAVTLRWTTPFPVATARALVVPPIKVTKGASGGPQKPPHKDGEAPIEVEMYDLGERAAGATFEFEVDGLVRTSQLPRGLGLGLGLAIALATLLGLIVAPRSSLEQRLRRRQAVLLAALDRADAAVAAGTAGATAERERIIGLLDQVYRQIDVVVGTGPRKYADPGVTWDRRA
jgi:hypothetical protein